MKNRPVTGPAKAHDRRSTLRRGAGILLFLLALALVGPSFITLAWETRTPGTVGEWLVVSLAALLLAGSVAVITTRVGMQRPATGSAKVYDRRSALRRGTGILLFLLALALVGPSFITLAWETRTPDTAGEWLVVSLAALLIAGSVAVIAMRVEMQFPVTGRFRFFRRMSLPARYRTRFAIALGFSLLVHALILSLQFGLPGIGLPGLAMPWAERRVHATNLTARLVAVPRPPAPASEPLQLRVAKSLELRPPKVASAVPPLSSPRREARASAPAAKARARDRKIPAKPQRQLLAQRPPQEETFKVPPPKRSESEQRAPETTAKKQTEEPPAVQATEQADETARLQASEEAARQRAEEDARQRALALQKELEAKKQEEARRQTLELEARRRLEETARQEAEEQARQRAVALQKEQEAKKLEEARRIEETLKQEELKKQEEVTRLALQAEALRRAEEAARQAAARKKELEAKRQAEEAAARAKEIAERQQAEAQAGAQRERERLAAQQAPGLAPGALSGKDLAAKALEQLRTPGAVRDDVLRPPSPPPRAENPRRRSVFGVERDVTMRMYVDSWRWKLERNGAMNYRGSAGWRSRDTPPIVTVSIRSDGSLEDVWIHRSSGVREIDEAVRRIARLYAPYSAFPPELARQYDVIEIRRVWSFDNTLKIMDEM